MLFIRHDRQNLNKLRTNSERCSQVGALCGTILVIITAVLLYFAITTEHGEQKTVYFIVSAVNIIVLFILIGITVYYVRKFMIREDLLKINNNNNLNSRNSSVSLRHNSSQSKFDQQKTNRANYALNQPIPIVIHKSASNLDQQQKPKEFGFYQI
jgi:hypothetical protein